MSSFNTYLEKIDRQFQSGIATEHSYRAPFQNYLESLLPDVLVTNEAKRSRVGAPDFILMDKKNIPFAYIETKDIGKSLNSKEYKEQFDRYKSGLDVLIITDYLEFQLYKRGILTQTVKIAKAEGSKIVPYNDIFLSNTEGVRQFEYLIQGLLDREGVNITIKSAEDLARRMAAKARLFADIIFRALEVNDEEFEMADGSLSKQYQSFKQILIGDISHAGFADIYAQTITYGMFAARLHDTTLENFSRQEAAELIPKSNPFLRKLFQYVASHDLDDRIKWIVDDLAEVFKYTDVAAILKDFGRSTQQTDPMIHFYETFLASYDASLRKARGVWYTPEPVVNFIVRAVDEILKTEFNLKDGLADTSKVSVDVKTDNFDKRKQDYKTTQQDVHRVQLLDPACGTGTFLAETIKHIHKKFKNQTGIWNSYVEEHLIPRLHGFELLMASYAMAHIKMDLLLRETGYTLKQQKRFKIFLTNTLEEHHKDAGTLFWAQWLADEAKQADAVKRDAPVMVVLGNPPYSGESQNRSEWIMKLMEDYKQEPGGGKLQERNPKWLNDDYVKFIRFGQYFIDKNTEGVLAFINNHSFLDNPTFRGMRWHLLTSFDKIYIIDLHGNAKKKETQEDGSSDQNVFDIQQGVSINLFIKTGEKKKKGVLAEVLHFDLYGNRSDKYKFLTDNKLASIDFKQLEFSSPQYFFVQKDFDQKRIFDLGFAINEIFSINVMGFQTHRDHFAIDDDSNKLLNRIKDFISLESLNDIEIKYEIKSSSDFDIKKSQIDLRNKNLKTLIHKCQYRPFEDKYVLFDRSIVDRPRKELLNHVAGKDNLCLGVGRQGLAVGDIEWCVVTVSKKPIDANVFRRGGVNVFPLYLYPESNDLFANQERVPNIKKEIVDKIGEAIGRRFEASAQPSKGLKPLEGLTTFTPEDVLDYIYAVLHTPTYRDTYKEFLKIDFPRVPYPKNASEWDNKVEKGKILRDLHLLESEEVDNYITTFPNDGDNIVGKPRFEVSSLWEDGRRAGKVWLNVTQYFDGVPEDVWNFYIGGYQPAQKWLKDRVGRKLGYEEVLHYQKMVCALAGTVRVMGEMNLEI
jgi:predicted helicase